MNERAETENVVIVIPSLNPDERLVDLIRSIREEETVRFEIIIVNDGSAARYDDIFAQVQDTYDCEIIRHAENMGKGSALKTAFNAVLLKHPEAVGVVTLDSDGQHRYEDMIACLDLFAKHPDALILGQRDFAGSIPFRSKFGNIVTRHVLKLLTGLDIKDTQTGLRVIPRAYLPVLLHIPGDRFEFEMNMLLETKKQHIPLKEVTIHTIYHNENASSHFRPLLDSAAIYAVFLKYIVSGVLSSALDLLLFTVFVNMLDTENHTEIFTATALARIISSLVNYKANRDVVFQNESQRSLQRYYTLALIQLALSGLLVSAVAFAAPCINPTIIKIFIDIILFFVNYQVQRIWVFRS